MKNPGKVRARTCGTTSPSQLEALRFIDSAKSPSTKIDGSLVNFRRRLSIRHRTPRRMLTMDIRKTPTGLWLRTRLVRITWTCSQSDRCSSSVHCQHPPWSPVSIGKPAPKIHQWTIYFCRWGFGWVDKVQCFRSARRCGAVGSSPDFSRVFHDIWLLGI